MNASEPKPQVGLRPCPAHITGAGRKIWESIAAELTACGIATQIDSAAFALLVSTYVEWLDALKQLKKHGPIARATTGAPRMSGYWSHADRTAARLKGLLESFGMTPSSRSSIKAVVPENKQVDDPAARYFA